MSERPTAPYAPRSGCSLCTIITNAQPKFSPHPPSGPAGPQYPASPIIPDSQWVSLPLHTPTPVSTGTFLDSPSSPATMSASNISTIQPRTLEDGREIVYRDRDITAWTARREKGEALASNGRHLVVAFNAHVESIYELVSALRPSGFRCLLTNAAVFPHLSGPTRCSALTEDDEGGFRPARQSLLLLNRTKTNGVRSRCSP